MALLMVGIKIGNRNAGVKQEAQTVCRGVAGAENAAPEVLGVEMKRHGTERRRLRIVDLGIRTGW